MPAPTREIAIQEFKVYSKLFPDVYVRKNFWKFVIEDPEFFIKYSKIKGGIYGSFKTFVNTLTPWEKEEDSKLADDGETYEKSKIMCRDSDEKERLSLEALKCYTSRTILWTFKD